MQKKELRMFPQRAPGARDLLQLVADGKQVEAIQVIRRHPEFLREYNHLIDCTGRSFQLITPFQYALWALDVHYMCPAILNCLKEIQVDKSISLELSRQFDELQSSGVKFRWNGIEYVENFFSCLPLINALTTYIDNYRNWSLSERMQFMCTNIGNEQRALPANIRQEYCNEDGWVFSQSNVFLKKLTRTAHFYNAQLERFQVWDANLTGLGTNFGLVRGEGKFCVSRTGEFRQISDEARDLFSLKLLNQFRKGCDLADIKQQLRDLTTESYLELS